MSCNGGSHPRINTLGRMTRAESGPDLRYEMTSGGGGTSRIYYSRRGVITDQNSDGYWWVPARRARAAGPAGRGGTVLLWATGRLESRTWKGFLPQVPKELPGRAGSRTRVS